MEGGAVHGVQQANRERPLFDQPDKGEGIQPINGALHIGYKRLAIGSASNAREAVGTLAGDHRHRRASHLRLKARKVAMA